MLARLHARRVQSIEPEEFVSTAARELPPLQGKRTQRDLGVPMSGLARRSL